MQSHAISKGIVKKKRTKTGLLFILLLLEASLGYSQTVTLHLKDESIEKAFRVIESQTGYNFVYSTETIRNARPVNLELTAEKLDLVLVKLFTAQPLVYLVEDRQIIVKAKDPGPKKESNDLSGKVSDEEGNSLQGVSVLTEDLKKGTLTDENGEFTLRDVLSGTILRFSYVGKQTAYITVSSIRYINLVLKTQSKALDETIIQAYGTTTKRLSTCDITKVSSEEISRQAITNPLAALEARVPGMIVTQSSGVAGSSFKVQLRGRTAIDPTITDDQPLFIIDGVPYAPNNNYLNTMNSALGTPFNSNGTIRPGGLSPFASINPEDIESIEVLKDADATAIYGSRGANGVVLMTTKTGKPGKTKFDFDIQQGVGRPVKRTSMMNTSEYLQMRREAFFNDSLANPGAGIRPTSFNAYDMLVWDTTRYTDLEKVLTGNRARIFDAQASISGGNAGTRFLVGGGYRRETSVFVGSPAFAQSSMHFNLTHAGEKGKFKMNLTANYSSSNNETYSIDLTSMLDLPPNLLIYDSSGSLAWNEKNLVSGWNNPLAAINARYFTNTDNLVANLTMDYRLMKDLRFKINSGYNTVALDEQSINPLSAQNPLQNIGRSASFSSRNFKSYIVEPHLDFVKRGQKGKLDALLGASWQYERTGSISGTGSGYIDDMLLNSLAGATSITATKNDLQYKYQAEFARAIYTWMNRYILNLSARRDGSSRFGPEKQFANFGSVGGAWVFSDEKWARHHLPFLSFGKLRASAGLTGNDKIADYLYLDTWKPAQNTYQGGTALVPFKLFNPDYRWEKTKKMELALDLGFLNDRILISAAYYQNKSSNQLINYKLPTTTGFTSIVENLDALVLNKGVEVTISSTPVKNKKLEWNASLNFTVPKTTLLRFPGLSSSSYANTYVVGQPLNLIYAYRYTGIDASTALYTFEDKNKDGALTTADKQALGSLDPRFYGGFSNSLTVGQFRMDALLQFTNQKGVGYLGNLSNVPGSIRNMPETVLQNASGTGGNNTLQRFTQNTSSSQAAYLAFSQFKQSDGIYVDASFVRLKSIVLSYSLPEKDCRRIGTSRTSVYISAQNLFTITNYKVGDPEVQSYLRLPPLRTIVAGIQLSF